jgi:hypothetical protein
VSDCRAEYLVILELTVKIIHSCKCIVFKEFDKTCIRVCVCVCVLYLTHFLNIIFLYVYCMLQISEFLRSCICIAF